MILLNPCADLRLPKIEDRLPQRLTQGEAHKLVKAPDANTAKGVRDRAILELFYSTGIRLAEMAALRLHDVNCRSALLRGEKGKGGKSRVVPMGRKAVESLQRYLLKVRAGWIGNRPCGTHLWLSSIEPHEPLKAQAIQVMVRQYGQRVGVRVTPHLWRHTCATHLVNNGANIAYVQQLLGHASLETTQVYTRVTLHEVKAAYHKAHPRSRV